MTPSVTTPTPVDLGGPVVDCLATRGGVLPLRVRDPHSGRVYYLIPEAAYPAIEDAYDDWEQKRWAEAGRAAYAARVQAGES